MHTILAALCLALPVPAQGTTGTLPNGSSSGVARATVQERLTSSDAVALGQWGSILALNGAILFVGEGAAPGRLSILEELAPDVWSERALHQFSGAPSAMALARDYGIVTHTTPGTPEVLSVRVFERDTGGPDAWGVEQVLALPACGSIPGCTALNRRFGECVAVGRNELYASDPMMVPGQPPGAGAVFAYQRDAVSGDWEVTRALAGETIGSGFGMDITAFGGLLVVSDLDEIFIYERDMGGTNAYGLMSSFPRTGVISAMTIGVHRLLIAYEEQPGLPQRVQVRERNTGGTNQWGLDAQLFPTFTLPSGFTIASNADTVYVGQTLAGSKGGLIEVFDEDEGSWERKWAIFSPNHGSFFGTSLVARDDRLYVGDPMDGGGSSPVASGAVWVLSETPKPTGKALRR